MRDMLQKPWFVGLLSLAALLFVYTNVVEPLIGDGSNRVANPIMAKLSDNLPFSSNNKTDAIVVKELAMADWEALATVNPKRNPFTPSAEKKKKTAKQSINWPSVSAIVIGSSRKFAIVNGNVVQEGQKSGKFKVVKISVNSVRVRFGKREKTLRLNARGGR